MEVEAAAFRDKLVYTAQRNLLKAKWLLPANSTFSGQISGGGCYIDHPKGVLNHHIQIGRIKFGLDNTDTSNNRTPMQSSGHLAALKLQLDTPPTLCHTDTVTPPTLSQHPHSVTTPTLCHTTQFPILVHCLLSTHHTQLGAPPNTHTLSHHPHCHTTHTLSQHPHSVTPPTLSQHPHSVTPTLSHHPHCHNTHTLSHRHCHTTHIVTTPTLCHTDTVTPPTLSHHPHSVTPTLSQHPHSVTPTLSHHPHCHNTHTLSHRHCHTTDTVTPPTLSQHPHSVTQHSFLCYCPAFCLHVTHSWHILITVAHWRQATHHFDKTRKNLCTSVAGAAFGYSWHTLATSIAQDTPPRYPSTLEYTPFSGGQTQAISALAELKADNLKPTGGPGSCTAT